jgi:tetratricopeptide (TPR) repeat protein
MTKDLRKAMEHHESQGLEWRHDGLGHWTSENIFEKLGQIGIAVDTAGFIQAGKAACSPTRLAEQWLENSSPQGFWEDFPYVAAGELWNRFLSDLDCPESIADAFRKCVNPEGVPSQEDLENQYALAKRILKYVSLPDGTPHRELFDKFHNAFPHDLGGWLLDLPFALAGKGKVDEAVGLSRAFAPLMERENLLGDLAFILAKAGRRDEAIHQVKANLEAFPDDVWVVIKGGDALDASGDRAGAEDLYRRAYSMTDPTGYDREGVMDRLLPLLEETGKKEEAERLRSETEGRQKVTIPFLKKNKIGRNNPCPCGSGKKHKKCCLG